MLRKVPSAREDAMPAAHAALSAFSRRRKRTQRPTPTLAGTQGRVLPPPVLDDFEYLGLRKSHSASCTMAAGLWPFFF